MSATLGLVRHLSLKRACNKALNRPGHGTSFGKQHGFRRVPSKQGPPKGSFLNFSSSVLGCAKCTPKVAFYPDRKTILLRVSVKSAQRSPPAPSRCHSERLYREESAVAGSSPALGSPNVSRCGNHLEILWTAQIDGIPTAPYACKVSRTVGFALVAIPPGLNSHRLGGPRFGL